MIIKDIDGRYEIKVRGNIVIGKIKGFWKEDDYKEYENEYMTKVYPLFKEKDWVMICDFSTYKLSSIERYLKTHISNNISYGMKHCAVVTPSKLIEMQLRIATGCNLSSEASGTCFSPKTFNSLYYAKEWVKLLGYSYNDNAD